jgi:hypothetical protein
MHKPLLQGALAGALLTPALAFPAGDTDIAELKSMLEAMKAEYEQRIQALESRLADAEREASGAARLRAEAAESRPMTAAVVQPAPSAGSPRRAPGSAP